MSSPSSAYHPPMTLASFVGLGLERVMSLVKSGQAPPEYAWTAFRGAWKYARMAAFGGEATVEASAARVAVCVACPASDATPTSQSETTAHWCGRSETVGPNATCGCLVYLTVGGVVTPAGKTCVASERCPRGKW